MLLALHLPDHSLSFEVVMAVSALAMVGGAAVTWRRTSAPKLSTFAAISGLLFILQMANFALPGGLTSGHLLGAGLAAILLGPAWGCLSVALVLVIQALAMGDGGVTALGANVFNMAIVGVLSASAIQAAFRGKQAQAAAFTAGFVSTFAAAAACAAELAISGVGSPAELAGSIVAPHVLVGLAEGVFTVAMVSAVAYRNEPNGRRFAWTPLAAAALVVATLVPFASSQPDALEATLETHAK